ncbi:unnamed protein product [Discosporangium mesarthrocarpum]
MKGKDESDEDSFPGVWLGKMVIERLESLGLLHAIHTQDGLVVTEEKLAQEVHDELLSRGGRAQAEELQPSFGVDIPHIEAAMESLARSDPSVHQVRSPGVELVTEEHMNQLAMEAERCVQTAGRMSIGDLASRFKLPAQFTVELIQSRVAVGDEGGLINASLKRGALISQLEEERLRVQVCGLCADASEPVSMLSLLNTCGTSEETVADMSDMVKDLTQSGAIEGTIRGQDYIPDKFWSLQRSSVDDFFARNGYLDHRTASKLMVRKPTLFVQESFPSAVGLETAVVSKGMVEQMDAQLQSAAAQRSWIEAWTVVPTLLSDGDVVRLLGMCKSCSRPAGDSLGMVQLAEVYAVSRGFLDDLIQEFKSSAVAKVTAGTSAAISGSHVPQDLLAETGDGISKGASCKHRRERRGAGKGRKAKEGKKQGDKESPMLHEICSCLNEWRAELQDHSDLQAAIAQHLLQPVKEVWARAAKFSQGSMLHGSTVALEFEEMFEACCTTFSLLCKGISALEQVLGTKARHTERGRQESDGSSSVGTGLALMDRAEAYLVRTRGAQLADLVTLRECSKLGIEFASQDASMGGGPERMPGISQEACDALTTVLPEDVGEALADLWSLAMRGSHTSQFTEHLEGKVLRACNLVVHRTEKKRERNLLLIMQRELVGRLSQSGSGKEVFQLVLILLFYNLKGAFILLPPEEEPHPGQPAIAEQTEFSWSQLLYQALRGLAATEVVDALDKLQSLIGGCHQARTGGETACQEEYAQAVGAEDEQLVDATEAVRAIGLSLGS